ncbi:Protein max [Pteropus alecto]|uniref:Protein max n=1 Tax=Pteropus alecto TaxID=9402 RepID=L5KEY0_PTEAL|nr:Protein max [Pteropus alecto]
MSDNDDIEVESDVSPGASSFPCGLSGGYSGWGSQRGDGGRGPGSRRLLPLPPPPGLGPPPSRSGLAPLRAPGLSGLLRLEADKRAHHNALERKRRDHIKDSFHSLRDSVPSLQGEKASRAQILDKATEYIQYMRRKNHTHQQDIDDLKRQNALLEQQVRALEKARSSAQLQTNYPSSDNSLYTNAKGSTISAFDGGSDSSSESEPEEPQSRKKLRMDS